MGVQYPRRTRDVPVGGRLSTFEARTVGPFGAETHCSHEVRSGDTIWMNCYGDTVCDGCSEVVR